MLGLELDDVSFDRKIVTFRPNDWRRLKTQTSWRVVPLWPQLEEILRPWVFGPRLERGGKLLFSSFAAGEESMLVETRKLVDRIGARVGWKRGEIRHRIFRHTYCAARLQTLDRGAPVSLYSVSPGAGARIRGDGAASLLTSGNGAAPFGGRGVPDRTALRDARRSANSEGF